MLRLLFIFYPFYGPTQPMLHLGPKPDHEYQKNSSLHQSPPQYKCVLTQLEVKVQTQLPTTHKNTPLRQTQLLCLGQQKLQTNKTSAVFKRTRFLTLESYS